MSLLPLLVDRAIGAIIQLLHTHIQPFLCFDPNLRKFQKILETYSFFECVSTILWVAFSKVLKFGVFSCFLPVLADLSILKLPYTDFLICLKYCYLSLHVGILSLAFFSFSSYNYMVIGISRQDQEKKLNSSQT